MRLSALPEFILISAIVHTEQDLNVLYVFVPFNIAGIVPYHVRIFFIIRPDTCINHLYVFKMGSIRSLISDCGFSGCRTINAYKKIG